MPEWGLCPGIGANKGQGSGVRIKETSCRHPAARNSSELQASSCLQLKATTSIQRRAGTTTQANPGSAILLVRSELAPNRKPWHGSVMQIMATGDRARLSEGGGWEGWPTHTLWQDPSYKFWAKLRCHKCPSIKWDAMLKMLVNSLQAHPRGGG